MAGRTKDNDIGLAPPAEPLRADYERDFYSWLMEQARLVREGQWSAIDRANLAEEIESLGREQFNKLESALRSPASHPEMGSSTGAALAKLGDIHQGSKDRCAGCLRRQSRPQTKNWRGAFAQLSSRTVGRRERTRTGRIQFPQACPYSFDEAMKRDLSR